VTLRDSDKVTDVAFDPHVNLAFYKDRTTEWVSISGTAVLTDDRALIHRLYREDWKTWFGNEGDPRHGTPDDPRMLLIGVRADSAHFMTLDKPQPVVLFGDAEGSAHRRARRGGGNAGPQRFADAPLSPIKPSPSGWGRCTWSSCLGWSLPVDGPPPGSASVPSFPGSGGGAFDPWPGRRPPLGGRAGVRVGLRLRSMRG
jgi:hypothetical protein